MPDIGGIPYVESSDLVSGWPTVSQSVAQEVSDQLASKLDLAGGKILQVVSVTKTNTFSTTNTAFTDVTDLSLTITPSSASNKVLVLAMLSLSNALSNYNTGARIIRGASTVISGGSGAYGDIINLDKRNGSAVYLHLDSPSSTAAETYKVQIRNEGGSTSAATINVMANFTCISSMLVAEVSA